MAVLQRMQNGQLKIFDTLIKTKSEIRGYSRDEKGVPIKRNDHLMDCLRYIVLSGMQFARCNDITENFRYKNLVNNSWMTN